MNRQRIERDRDAVFVPQAASYLHALSNKNFCRCVISLLACQNPSRKERSRSSFRRRRRASEVQKFSQPVPAFREILPHLPKPKERQAQPQTPVRVFGFYQPLQRSAKIIVLCL